MNVITILCDTLRRDHCGAYNPDGKPLDQLWSDQQPNWVVPTPNMKRLAERGTIYDNCWCGSTPCMPARRDIYTGRHEFLERGWGPLAEDDLDLPRQVSGPPNRSLRQVLADGHKISYLITDHFHLWEQGAGNYHMGYSGFDFIRGIESDAWYTDPVDFFCPANDGWSKAERHWRNVHMIRHCEEDYFAARVFRRAADWLEHNHTYQDFYLHLDCFTPHEPWDPPEELLRQFWPAGYDVDFPWGAGTAYAPWAGQMTETQMNFARARYAANVVLTDRWLGVLLDKLDALNLWDNTLVIFTSDHGTYNGDHGRMGKLQTHTHDAIGHVPLILCHPTLGHGERRDPLVQLVDLYPTTLAAVGKPVPRIPADKPLHGVNLLPTLQDAHAPTRDFAVAGQFGKSVTITDGQWILHQSPPDPSPTGNQPLIWHGFQDAKFLPYRLGPVQDVTGSRPVLDEPSWDTATWLSDKLADPNERLNLAGQRTDQVQRLGAALRQRLTELHAPPELAQRLALDQGPTSR